MILDKAMLLIALGVMPFWLVLYALPKTPRNVFNFRVMSIFLLIILILGALFRAVGI